MRLDFLSNVTVSAAPVKKAATVNRGPKQRQPVGGLTIRLFKDGSVYPSNDLITRFGLDYSAKTPEGKTVGTGLDVIDSRDMAAQINTTQPFVGIIPTPRSEGRTDLFAMCRYEADGTPATTVAEQGSTTYGSAELIPMLESVYGDDFKFNEEGYVDLLVFEQQPITAPDGRFFAFKKVSRGANAGKKDYVVRDNATIYAIVPSQGTAGDTNAALPATESGTSTETTTTGKVVAGAGTTK